MANTKTRIETDKQGPCESPHSSPGDDPVVVTPKDIEPDKATARDITVRPLNSPDLEVREEAMLDEAIEETFPASDPIAIPAYEPVQEKRKLRKDNAGSTPQQPKGKG